jgi:hypothetical protein
MNKINVFTSRWEPAALTPKKVAKKVATGVRQ